MKSKLMDRLNSTVKEMSEAVKHLESSDLQKARQWRKDLKILKKKYEKSQSDYLYGGIDEESGLFENDAENIVRNQIGTLQRANRNLMEAQDYGEKTNEELFRIKEKFKGINQKNRELVGEVGKADGLLSDINKIISRNKRVFKLVFIGISVLVLLLLYLKFFR